ncbi:MAG: DUF3332 domain-containing protein [Prevotella sp.]|nr:DUF3332 domain-containing protein [Prevotella sp.]
MKAKYLKISAILLAATMLSTSCVGSFSLFNKLASWNKTATKSKFLNEIIFLVISPAYGICAVADYLVLNTIEFWSGSNPVTANIGKTVNVLGSDGNYYAVKTLEDGYEITQPNGDMLRLVYNATENSWSKLEDGVMTELFRFNEDGTVKATLPTGEQMDVALNDFGVAQVKDAMSTTTYWAMR